MASNQRPMDDSQVISPWGMAVRALSPASGQATRSVPKRERSHRIPAEVKPERWKNGCEKLTDGQIQGICKTVMVREKLLKKIDDEMSAKALAKKHGVCVRTITRAVRMNTQWVHVGDE